MPVAACLRKFTCTICSPTQSGRNIRADQISAKKQMLKRFRDCLSTTSLKVYEEEGGGGMFGIQH